MLVFGKHLKREKLGFVYESYRRSYIRESFLSEITGYFRAKSPNK